MSNKKSVDEVVAAAVKDIESDPDKIDEDKAAADEAAAKNGRIDIPGPEAETPAVVVESVEEEEAVEPSTFSKPKTPYQKLMNKRHGK